jgi:hypothetical protein
MPNFRKLDPTEVQVIENKGIGLRKQTEKLYDSILADYEVGEYGEAVLDEGENRLTVRNRMKAAATRRGIALDFRRTQGDLIRFKVVEPDSIIGKIKSTIAKVPTLISSAPPAPAEPPAPAKRRGGRPKKNPTA